MRNQVFVVKRNLKLPENVSIINVQKIPGDLFCRGFLYLISGFDLVWRIKFDSCG